jgi:hypothetical protein
VAESSLTRGLFRQPEVARQNPGFPQAVAWAQVNDVLARIEGRLIDRPHRSTPYRLSLRVPPQMVHRVQLGRRPGEQTDLDAQLLGPFEAVRRFVLTGSVLEDHDPPTPPVGADRREESLVRLLGPLLGDQERDVTGFDVDRPVEDALGAVPRDRHPDLLADGAVAGVERRGLGDDRLVEHQHHGADTAFQAAF